MSKKERNEFIFGNNSEIELIEKDDLACNKEGISCCQKTKACAKCGRKIFSNFHKKTKNGHYKKDCKNCQCSTGEFKSATTYDKGANDVALFENGATKYNIDELSYRKNTCKKCGRSVLGKNLKNGINMYYKKDCRNCQCHTEAEATLTTQVDSSFVPKYRNYKRPIYTKSRPGSRHTPVASPLPIDIPGPSTSTAEDPYSATRQFYEADRNLPPLETNRDYGTTKDLSLTVGCTCQCGAGEHAKDCKCSMKRPCTVSSKELLTSDKVKKCEERDCVCTEDGKEKVKSSSDKGVQTLPQATIDEGTVTVAESKFERKIPSFNSDKSEEMINTSINLDSVSATQETKGSGSSSTDKTSLPRNRMDDVTETIVKNVLETISESNSNRNSAAKVRLEIIRSARSSKVSITLSESKTSDIAKEPQKTIKVSTLSPIISDNIKSDEINKVESKDDVTNGKVNQSMMALKNVLEGVRHRPSRIISTSSFGFDIVHTENDTNTNVEQTLNKIYSPKTKPISSDEESKAVEVLQKIYGEKSKTFDTKSIEGSRSIKSDEKSSHTAKITFSDDKVRRSQAYIAAVDLLNDIEFILQNVLSDKTLPIKSTLDFLEKHNEKVKPMQNVKDKDIKLSEPVVLDPKKHQEEEEIVLETTQIKPMQKIKDKDVKLSEPLFLDPKKHQEEEEIVLDLCGIKAIELEFDKDVTEAKIVVTSLEDIIVEETYTASCDIEDGTALNNTEQNFLKDATIETSSSNLKAKKEDIKQYKGLISGTQSLREVDERPIEVYPPIKVPKFKNIKAQGKKKINRHVDASTSKDVTKAKDDPRSIATYVDDKSKRKFFNTDAKSLGETSKENKTDAKFKDIELKLPFVEEKDIKADKDIPTADKTKAKSLEGIFEDNKENAKFKDIEPELSYLEEKEIKEHKIISDANIAEANILKDLSKDKEHVKLKGTEPRLSSIIIEKGLQANKDILSAYDAEAKYLKDITEENKESVKDIESKLSSLEKIEIKVSEDIPTADNAAKSLKDIFGNNIENTKFTDIESKSSSLGEKEIKEHKIISTAVNETANAFKDLSKDKEYVKLKDSEINLLNLEEKEIKASKNIPTADNPEAIDKYNIENVVFKNNELKLSLEEKEIRDYKDITTADIKEKAVDEPDYIKKVENSIDMDLIFSDTGPIKKTKLEIAEGLKESLKSSDYNVKEEKETAPTMLFEDTTIKLADYDEPRTRETIKLKESKDSKEHLKGDTYILQEEFTKPTALNEDISTGLMDLKGFSNNLTTDVASENQIKLSSSKEQVKKIISAESSGASKDKEDDTNLKILKDAEKIKKPSDIIINNQKESTRTQLLKIDNKIDSIISTLKELHPISETKKYMQSDISPTIPIKDFNKIADTENVNVTDELLSVKTSTKATKNFESLSESDTEKLISIVGLDTTTTEKETLTKEKDFDASGQNLTEMHDDSNIFVPKPSPIKTDTSKKLVKKHKNLISGTLSLRENDREIITVYPHDKLYSKLNATTREGSTIRSIKDETKKKGESRTLNQISSRKSDSVKSKNKKGVASSFKQSSKAAQRTIRDQSTKITKAPLISRQVSCRRISYKDCSTSSGDDLDLTIITPILKLKDGSLQMSMHLEESSSDGTKLVLEIEVEDDSNCPCDETNCKAD